MLRAECTVQLAILAVGVVPRAAASSVGDAFFEQRNGDVMASVTGQNTNGNGGANSNRNAANGNTNAANAKKGDRKAGLTLVESVPAHPSCSSVEGGIFSRKFTHAGEDSGPNDPLGGNKSNLPSLQGGIFEDHSNDPVLPSPRSQNRSQLSSVPGGIFAPLPRPDTVEYGSERYKDGFTIGGARPF